MNVSSFKQYCATLNIRWTATRKEVLYVLWSAQKPLKAYEILDALLIVKPNSTPTTVYRSLIFFEETRVVHKIESIQAFTLCGEPEKRLPFEVLMVCHDCHKAIETYDANFHAFIQKMAIEKSFHLNQAVVELKGLCRMCL